MSDPAYIQHYLFIVLFTVVAAVFAVLPLLLQRVVAPRKPSRLKNTAYECGLESTGDSWQQSRVQYYLYALLFVVFDVEVAFIYPWAVALRGLGIVALVEMAVFLAILLVALLYAWKKGVLEW